MNRPPKSLAGPEARPARATDLRQDRQATDRVRAEAVEIVRLCVEAGRPDDAAKFVLAGIGVDRLRRVLAVPAPSLHGEATSPSTATDDIFGARSRPWRSGLFDSAAIPSRFDLKPVDGLSKSGSSDLAAAGDAAFQQRFGKAAS